MILSGRGKKEQCFQCSVSFTSAAQLETLLKGHQNLKVTDLECYESHGAICCLCQEYQPQPLPFQGLKTASVMSRENQFHSNQAEMRLKVVYLRAGAAQQSLLLGIPGTFQKSQTAASRQCLAGNQQPGTFWNLQAYLLGHRSFSLMLNQVKIRIVILNEDSFRKCRTGESLLLLICSLSIFPDYSNCERGSSFQNNTVSMPFKTTF